MASQSQVDLQCLVCFDVFKEPVILSCSHSFCEGCLHGWWTKKGTQECPICKKVSEHKEVLCNLALKNLCETFSEEKLQSSAEDICSLHCENLKLFCLDHQQPVCVICRDSEKHTDHKFRPINEALEQRKEELQQSLKALKDKLEVFHQVTEKFNQTAQHIKIQTQHTETQIKEQFKKLHQVLEEEEEARIAAVRQEEQQKSRAMKEKLEAMSREMVALSDVISDTEDVLRARHVSFLLKYKAAVEKLRLRPLLDDPQLLPGALIDQAKHLGNLGFNIWQKIKNMISYTPVILDPNTANARLILSDDLSSVVFGRMQQLPENPERVGSFSSVLGSEGFSSGTHSWDVEVGNHARWELGVLQESVQRKGDLWSGLWRLQLCDGQHRAISPPHTCSLLTVKDLQRIRVNLDFNTKQLTFSDTDTNKHVYTFMHAFTGKLFPYIWTGFKLPVRILPMKVDVNVHT
ncbi:E3 ubiquitin-protein ligase TRIM35-like [Xenentodon cancila]